MATTKTAETKTLKQKRAESKYRVMQHATPSGKDIMSRLRNRTISKDALSSDRYTMDEQIVAASRMHKKDVIIAAKENAKRIAEKTNKLETAVKNETNKKTISKPSENKDTKPE